MKYSSETKTHGSIRTMKSGGAAGVVLGLAAVGLAMGTSTVSANEKVVDANQPKVQETGVEVKESTIKNETPTGNASTNLNAPAGAISEKQKADLGNENKVTGETPVTIDHTKVQEEAKNAEQVGVNVVQDKTQVAPTTSTAEDTAKAVKSITAKETEKSNELKSTATAHSTAVSNWVDQKNSTVAFNNELDKAHLKAVESYNDFIKTLDADTAAVVAQHKDAIIKVTEIIQKASDGTSVDGYQAYIRSLAEQQGINKEAIKDYLVKKAEYNSKSTANSETVVRNLSNSTRIDAENKAKSQSVDAENTRRSTSAQKVVEENTVKSNSTVAENNRLSTSAKTENERRSNSAKEVENDNNAKSLSVKAENEKRSNSAKAENERRSNSAKDIENDNIAKSNSVVKENERRSNSAKAENEKRSNAVKNVENNNVARSNSVVEENKKRSNSVKAENARLSLSVDAENERRSNSAKEENINRSLAAKTNTAVNTSKSNEVEAENNRRSLSAQQETIRRSNSAKEENNRRSNSAEAVKRENYTLSESISKENSANEEYNRRLMTSLGLDYTGNYSKDSETLANYYKSKNTTSSLDALKNRLPKTGEVGYGEGGNSTTETFTGTLPDSYTYGGQWVEYVRKNVNVVTNKSDVVPVTLFWQSGLTSVSMISGGELNTYHDALDKRKAHSEQFNVTPEYALGFTGETIKSSGLYSKTMKFRIKNAGIRTDTNKPVDAIVTATAYLSKEQNDANVAYFVLGTNLTSSLNYNYSGMGAMRVSHEIVDSGTDTPVNGVYGSIISDVDWGQVSSIDINGKIKTYNPVTSGLSPYRETGYQNRLSFGSDNTNDSPAGTYLFAGVGSTINYFHAGSTDLADGVYNGGGFRNDSTWTFVEFALFGNSVDLNVLTVSPKYLKPLKSYSPKDSSFTSVSFEPATYEKVSYKPETSNYVEVSYEKVSYTPISYTPVTYTPGTPPKYEPVSYEKVSYTPRDASWKPVGYEKVPFNPADTSWKPVGYTPLKFTPKNTDWNPVPYVPTPYVPEKLLEIPKEPVLEMAKLTAPTDPVFHKIPKEPKVPTVHYHLTALNENTPVEKLAQNEDGVNINNESVAKNSINHFILKPKALPAGRPITTSIVLSDYMSDGIELDIAGMQKVNKSWDISYNTSTRLLEVKGVSTEYDKANADRTIPYTPTAFTVIYKVVNDGATYENVFKMDVNGGNTGSVNVEYRVEGTNILLGKAKDVVNESVGSSYDTTDHILETITKNGVTYERVTSHVDGSEKGQVEEGTKLVTYYYHPVTPTPDTGGVVVHYRDEEGNFIKEDHEKVKGGKVGDPYDTTKDNTKEITYGGKTYRLISNKTVGNEIGKITKGITEVTYIYKKVTPDNPKTENTGNVDVEYRVEGTNTLLGTAKDSVHVSVGSDYDTTDLIHGRITKDDVTYERVPSHVEGEEKGKVTKEGKVVVYYYKPISETPSVGGVVIHYVDEEGNTLKEDKTVSKGEKVGTPYDTTKNKHNEITVEGKVYKLVLNKTVGIENGKVTEGITEVTYVYKQVTPDKPKGNGYTSYSNKVRIHTPGSPNNPNNPNNPNGNGNHKIQPVKNNTNKEGKNINNKALLQTDVNYYVAEWDLDQYINDKSSKSAIAKGFGYLENYPEHAVTPITKDYYAVTSKGDKVEDLDFYKADSAKLNELPEHVQQFIKDSGIDVSKFGKFQVWVAKDYQDFYDKYVKTGQDIFFHLPMAVNKGFTGEYENQTYQIDFGNGYYGNVVHNNVPNLTPKKDVVVDGKSANGGTITYGQEFSYLLSGAKLPGNRGSHVWEYRYIDDYDQTGDKYLGKYKVVATTDITVSQLEEVKEDTTFKEDVTLEDGTVVKAGQKVVKGSKVHRTHVIKTGEDLTKFTESVHDEANGIITISFKEDFLKSVVDSSEFGADASIDMKRVAYGEFYNKYTNRANGVDYISNTVKSRTPKPDPVPEKPNTPQPGNPTTPNTPDKPAPAPEKPNTPIKPEKPQLPYTGTKESASSLVGVAILSVLGLAGLARRKR